MCNSSAEAERGPEQRRVQLSPKDSNLAESYFALPSAAPDDDSVPGNAATSKPTRETSSTTTSPTAFPRSPAPPFAFDLARRPPHTLSPTATPTPTTTRKSLSPLSSIGTTRTPFTLFTPTTLVQKLLSPDTSTSDHSSILLLDIRTHTAYLHRRLKSSLNICVPSTLLRRPAYGIDRVAEGLQPLERTKLSKYATATTIIVLDLDSVSLVEGGGITSLLAKFLKAGFGGTLGWVKGGFAAISETAKATPEGRTLLERGPVHTTAEPASPTTTTTTTKPSLTLPLARSNRPILQVRDLPVAAFQQASTSTFVHAGLPSSTSSLGSSHSTHPPGAIDARTGARIGLGKRRSSGMEGLTLNIIPPLAAEKGLVHLPLTTTPAGETRMASNPFFDNIRQNNEALSLTRSLANLSPIELAIPSPTSRALLPKFLSSFLDLDPLDRASLLARQFYDLEVAERERLEGTMNWHANVQGKEVEGEMEREEGWKKFGISAGVELGNANRYKNIFPYDHARVRLTQFPLNATDYINASHISLSGTSQRYIASQGPLPTTYNDFWQMCAQEEVGVIIMLTNLHEGGREKCGRYWIEEPGSEWDIRVEGEIKEDPVLDQRNTGFFSSPSGSPSLSTSSPSAMSAEPTLQTTLRRTIYFKRKSDPASFPPRKIQHIQFIGWPDFDVPANTGEVLGLVKEVEQAQESYLNERGREGKGGRPPVLAHCSAGVGRTGVFILVASLLAQFRTERQIRQRLSSPPPSHPPSSFLPSFPTTTQSAFPTTAPNHEARQPSLSPPHSPPPLPASLPLRRGSSMKRAREIDIMDLDPGASISGGRSRSESNVDVNATTSAGGMGGRGDGTRGSSTEVGEGFLDRFDGTTIHSPPPSFSPSFGVSLASSIDGVGAVSAAGMGAGGAGGMGGGATRQGSNSTVGSGSQTRNSTISTIATTPNSSISIDHSLPPPSSSLSISSTNGSNSLDFSSSSSSAFGGGSDSGSGSRGGEAARECFGEGGEEGGEGGARGGGKTTSPPRLISFASTAALFSSPTSTPTRLEPPSIDPTSTRNEGSRFTTDPTSTKNEDSTMHTIDGIDLVPSHPLPSHPHPLSSLPSSIPASVSASASGLSSTEIGSLIEEESIIFEKANEMREFRMSMIANFRQFVCVYECCLEGTLEEIRREREG